MQIFSVHDPEFAEYGRVVEGVPAELLAEVADALERSTPLPEGTEYVASDPALEGLPAAAALTPMLYGGVAAQWGWCNGHNLALNCLEYHRASEFNLGTGDFVLLLARQADVRDGRLGTDTVRAFRVPARTLVEVYATTLHYAPCQVSEAGFRVLVVLPAGTNGPLPELPVAAGDAGLLWASNKWLLAHPESAEAAAGAHVGLDGPNVRIPNLG